MDTVNSPNAERDRRIESSRLIVVKVGTNVLADAQGQLNAARIESLVGQLVRLRTQGRTLVLVTSGAIGAGLGLLKLPARPTDLAELQACAAVGQAYLMQLYQSAFDAYSVRTAQLLLTAGDFDHRGRYLNVRNTLRTLFQYGCLPIINENDTVSTAEIKFGDNDQLAAMTANLLQAPLLILLTNVDGLYTADPRVDPHATLQTLVPKIDGRVAGLAAETKSGLGTGGMKSKLKAARLATAAGAAVLMANGSHEAILDRIFAGEPVGTFFMPQAAKVSARKRWLGFTARPRGELTLDPGAVRALLAQGKSLLPVGVRAVSGQFQKGDLLILRDPQGREFARGLTHYNSTQIQAMLGRTTAAIQQSLGVCPYPELIHRDHLVITDADWLLEAESAVKVLEHANVSQPTPGAGGV